jgi:hypothetical protein
MSSLIRIDPGDNIIQQVADGRIAKPHLLRHYLQTSAAFDKVQDELQIFGGQSCQKRQVERSGHSRAAGFAGQRRDFQHFVTGGAKVW